MYCSDLLCQKVFVWVVITASNLPVPWYWCETSSKDWLCWGCICIWGLHLYLNYIMPLVPKPLILVLIQTGQYIKSLLLIFVKDIWRNIWWILSIRLFVWGFFVTFAFIDYFTLRIKKRFIMFQRTKNDTNCFSRFSYHGY